MTARLHAKRFWCLQPYVSAPGNDGLSLWLHEILDTANETAETCQYLRADNNSQIWAGPSRIGQDMEMAGRVEWVQTPCLPR
jgi:hypothetical protein